MTISLRKQLMAFFLLVAVLLAPFNSFAQDVTSGAKDTCACHLMPADCGAADEGGLQDGCPGDSGQQCCDCEDHGPEAAELPTPCKLSLNIPEGQLFHPITIGLIPEVYLAIFVPPQSCSSR
jgi:hypothetical protein